MSNRHIIVTITGPSGSGKTVLSELLRAEGFEPLVSTTTRLPRSGEKNGVDYFFISEEEFQKQLKEGKFMENVEYNGTLYGVSALEAARAFEEKKPAILVAEPHGVEQITFFCRQKGWELVRVFIDNDTDLLLGRLLNRLRTDLSGKNHGDESLPEIKKWVEKISLLRQQDREDFKNILIDFAKDFNLPQTEKIISGAAHRLRSFDFEQKNWVEPARLGGYDYYVSGFCQERQSAVVNDILNQVGWESAPSKLKM